MVSILALIGTAVATGGFAAGIPPINRYLTYEFNKLAPNQLPSEAELTTEFHRGMIAEQEYYRMMRMLGYDTDVAKRILYAASRLPEVEDLVTLRMRGVIEDKQFMDKMASLGFMSVDAELIYEAKKRIIEASQLIELRRRGKITEQEYYDGMAMVGYSEEDADKLYSLSQTLLSAAQLTELRRRGAIGEQEYYDGMARIGYSKDDAAKLYTLARTLPPAQALIEMHRRGEIGENEYYDMMAKLGYAREDATKLFNISMSLAPAEALIELRRRGKITEDEYYDRMWMLGYNRGEAEDIYEAQRRLIEREAILRLKWRGEISEDEYYKRMEALGFSEEEADMFERASLYFPPPGDLVRFAVREVYTPEIVEKYGQLEDLPQKFLEEARKAGMTEEQAKNYWAAHWVLPSVEMGYRMLHRRIIDEDELKTLMKVQDIMPYWRDKLIALSYEPYTRVDARRMYELGVLSEEELYNTYRDLGYDDEHAKKLVLWTKLYTIADDLRARYSKGWITADDVFKELIAAGLSEQGARKWLETIVKAEKPTRVEDERKLTKSEIIKGVKAGIITQEQAVTLLRDLGYEEWEAWYILAINKVVSAGDPEGYWEMKAVTEEYKRSQGLPYKPVPKELIDLEKQIKAQKAKIDEAKEKHLPDALVSQMIAELTTLEYRYRQLIKSWESMPPKKEK